MHKTRSRGTALLPSMIVIAMLLVILGFAVSAVVERATVGRKLAQVQVDMRTYAIALEAYHVDRLAYPPTLILAPSAPEVTGRFETSLVRLSTPIAYMSNALLPEPFNMISIPRQAPDPDRPLWFLFRGWDVLWEGGPPPLGSGRQPLYFYISNSEDPADSAFLAAAYMALAPSYQASFQDWLQVIGKKWMIISPGTDGFYTADQSVYQNPDPISAFVVEQAEVAIPRFNGRYDPTNGLTAYGDIVRFQGAFTPTPTPLPHLTPRPEDNGVGRWMAYD